MCPPLESVLFTKDIDFQYIMDLILWIYTIAWILSVDALEFVVLSREYDFFNLMA